MGTLQVALFGSMRVTHDNWRTEVTMTREIQALFAYLLLQRHRVHSRDMLASIFWSEYSQEKARGSLNTALWKLKKVLEPEGPRVGTYLKNGHSSEVGFNRESKYWLDVEVFEREVNQILSDPFQSAEETHVTLLEKELKLYTGELLEAFYDDWALRERERLRTLHLEGMIYLLQYYEFHGFSDKALACGQQILNLDPLREEIHRVMMRLYLANGQRSLALRQYEICRLALAKELGVSPMEDTQILYTRILTGTDSSAEPILSKEKISIDQALRQLREASQALDLAKEQIQQTLQLITKL